MMFLAWINGLAGINQEFNYMRPWSQYTEAYLNVIAASITLETVGQLADAVSRYYMNDR